MLASVPIANPDVLALTADVPAVISFLTLNDTDADNHALSVSSTTSPNNGTLVDNGDGSYTYTPNTGFTGSDTFDYTVTDNIDGSDSATVTLSVNAAFDAEAARDQILNGVSTLANPTQPGHMVTFGPTAVSISNYPGRGLSEPMIAAATMGDGRVVALPDHQWLNMGSYGSDPSMSAFYQNSIAWISGTTDKSISVVMYNQQAAADWLVSQGYTNVVNATAASLTSDLVGADVLIGWLGSNPSQTNLDAVEGYVNDGGGLFISDYGIGYQWWWNKATPDIPSNQLLRNAGIGFTQEYPFGSVAQTINRASGQITSSDVLDILEDSSGATSAELDEFGVVYDRINAVLPEVDSLKARLDAGFTARINFINPTPATPVSDGFEQALLMREMNLIKDLPPAEVTAHRTAEAVYGLIPGSAPRLVNQPVTVDSNVTGMIATGLYIVPGEVVQVTVPQSLVDQGYQIKISGHRDNISGRSSWNRVPNGVQRSFAIDSTSIVIASAFGGAIYLDVGGQAGGTAPDLGDVGITIDNAIAVPHFILGQTTDAQWIASIRNNPAPYAEFVSDHLAFSVPSAWIRSLDNPTQLMTAWDSAVSFQDWVGGFENTRTGPDRINYDVQISVGLLHAGYPIQGPTSYGDKIVDYQRLVETGDWGWFHELGHEMQRHPELGWGWDNPWTFSGDTEVTVNIFANAALEQMVTGSSTAGWGYSARPDLVMGRALTTVNDATKPLFDQKDPYPFYFQLADGEWGWQGYRDVLSSYVADQQNNPSSLPQNAQQEKDQWLTRWSEQTGYDMTEYMVNHWGLEVSQTALDAVAAMALPSWMPLAADQIGTQIFPGESTIQDLAGAGLSLDGTATLVSVGNPANGTLADNGDGTFTYTPNLGFEGTDTYQVTYQSSASNQQTFAMNIEVSSAGVLLERFDNIAGNAISDLTNHAKFPNSPDLTSVAQLAETPTNAADSYGMRMRAYVTAPATGDYTFWIASDDNGQLLLSSNTDPANATEIASVSNWTSSREWTKYTSQQSVSISLQAGEMYYLEALMKEGGGGDNLAVAWSGPTISGPTVIEAQFLTVFGVPLNFAPEAVADSSSTNEDNSVVVAPLTNDTDPDGDTLVIDSLTQGVNGTVVNNGDGTVTYTPNANFNGNDSFTYTISDGNGGTDTATVSVTVNAVNDAPVAGAVSVTTNEDDSITINWLAAATDVDGDPLTLDSFAQGTNGTVTDNGDGTVTYTPNGGFAGNDSFNFAVTDGTLSATATATVTLTDVSAGPGVLDLTNVPILSYGGTQDVQGTVDISNAGSTITLQGNVWKAIGFSYNVTANTVLEFDFSSSIEGEEHGITLTNSLALTADRFKIHGSQYGHSPSFDFDNYSGAGSPQHYAIPFGQYFTGQMSYLALSNDHDVSNPTGEGTWSNLKIYESPVPVANNDSLTVDEDTAGDVNLLTNDSGQVTVTEVTQGSNGTVTNNNGGIVTFTPNANFNGSDSFSYTITDALGRSDTAIVNVTVNPINDAPIASGDSVSIDEDGSAAVSVLGNDSDIDGDSLSIAGITQGANGTVVDNGDGTITYTPNANFNGSDSFTYTISDGNGGTDTASVSVTVNPINDAPVASGDSVSVDENGSVVVSVLGNDNDIDGDSLSITGITQGANGTVEDNGDGTVTYTPIANFNGSDSFTYTISDGNGGSDTASVNITINAARVDDTDLVAHLELDGNGNDSSPNGSNNSGTTVDDATFLNDPERGQVLSLDGNLDYLDIADSADINLGTHGQRTVSLWFKANAVTNRQVLYEEGGGSRGLSIYLEDGLLYIGGWNTSSNQSAWAGTFLSTTVTASEWNHVTLTLNGGTSVQSNAIKGYLNGTLFDSGAGSQLWSHNGDIGVGRNDGQTRYHNGKSSTRRGFAGLIDDFRVYNRTLSASEIATLAQPSGDPNLLKSKDGPLVQPMATLPDNQRSMSSSIVTNFDTNPGVPLELSDTDSTYEKPGKFGAEQQNNFASRQSKESLADTNQRVDDLDSFFGGLEAVTLDVDLSSL